MGGISLLETIVVVAIIAIFSLIGINTINNFKIEASLDNAANELVSDIRLARSRSMNGELFENETRDDFQEDNLPEYGLYILPHGYEVVRNCLKLSGESCSSEVPIETHLLNNNHSLSPQGRFYFERMTGKTNAEIVLTITDYSINSGRQILISEDMLISITKF